MSAVAPPVSLKMEDIGLDSLFQKKVIWNDFNKNTFETLKNDGSRWLIIDLIDERLSVFKTGGSYVTYSTEAAKAGVIPPGSAKCQVKFDGKDYFRGDVRVRDSIQEFCRKIKELYPEERVIIHQAWCVDQYWSKDSELRDFPSEQTAFGHEVNQLLEYMYGILKDELPGAHVINCMNGFYGAEDHTWGLSIIHYEKDYYRKFMEELERIVTMH